MNSDNLPDITEAKKYYDVSYDSYAIAMYHPVTTEISNTEEYASNYIKPLLNQILIILLFT